MTLIPHRTVVSQVAVQLTEEIRQGTWKDRLPSERRLCEKMQVSRSTLRQALQQMRGQGVIESRHGVGHRVLLKALRRTIPRHRSIGLLIPDSPEPLARLRPNVAFWIEELKEQLHEFGCELRIHYGRGYYQAEPQKALSRLLKREAHSGWIVALATEQVQRWLMEHQVPCVVAGSCYEGIHLPSVDLDYRAICRHAAGELFRRGHCHIVMLKGRGHAAGEAESERGFLEAAEISRQAGVRAHIVWHDSTVESLTACLRTLLKKKEPPTGLVVGNSNWCLTVITKLLGWGRRIPEDISVISRNDDPFLDYVAPQPARYRNSPHVFAKKLLTMALDMAEGRPLNLRPSRIFPRFLKGESLGPAPGGQSGILIKPPGGN